MSWTGKKTERKRDCNLLLVVSIVIFVLTLRSDPSIVGIINTANNIYIPTLRADDDDLPKKSKEWNAPLWTRGLIVKPDAAWRMKQFQIWGTITLIGAAFPPAQDYMGRFVWLVCVAQLRFRGMPKEMSEGGGLGISFGGGRGAKHGKVAWLLGVTTWVVGAAIVYGLMPQWARGRRWTGTLGFAMQNLIFGVVCSYLQPYKG